ESIDVVVLEVDTENRRLSLGHKQLEENPWDVYESIFTVGSVHQGTISQMNDKGATVTLPYGVEGFAPMRHLEKADKSKAKNGETLDFKVIEFSKENKKIIVSHTRVNQDGVDDVHTDEGEAKKERATKKTVKKINDTLEKTTLGDLDVLANLKEELEKADEGDK
ncbi:MAG: S1 RNA-binding domain-containing protein, partial [Bacteroidales bacterium]|nr:S1 RNA-binding domain-containing protein [Bacteroidales bacterium]